MTSLATTPQMNMGPGRAPQQSRLVERGVKVGKRGRPKLVGVIRELPLVKLVSRRVGRPPGRQAFGHRCDTCSERRQRRAHASVDIGCESGSKRGHDYGDGLFCDTGRSCWVKGNTAFLAQRTHDPAGDRGFDALSEVEREGGELSLVVRERRFGLRFHLVRLR